MIRRLAVALVLAASVATLTGCVGAPPTTLERPAALADLPEVTLTAPGAASVGGSPVFAWDPVDGAETYSLAVADASGPIWGWQGDATEVRFGGYDREPAAGVGAQRLRSAAWWSVVALADDGSVVAVSRQRAVSPDGSAPVPLGAAPASSAPEVPSWSLENPGLCALVSDAEAAEFLEGELAGAGEPEIEGGGRTYYCRWERADDDLLGLSVSISPNYSRERWDELVGYYDGDPAVVDAAGIGDGSLVAADWGGTVVQVYVDEAIVSVRSGFTSGAEPASIELAETVIDRWRENR